MAKIGKSRGLFQNSLTQPPISGNIAGCTSVSWTASLQKAVIGEGRVMNKVGASLLVGGLLFAGALALAGCGSNDTTSSGGAGVLGGGGGGGGGGPPPPPPVPPPPVAGVPTLVITLANPTTGAATTAAPATARAIVRDAAGVAIPSVVVTFTTDTSLAALVPPSGTALTDATGTATVGLNLASLTAAGAATLTATTQVPATTGSLGFSVTPPNVTLSTPVFGTNPLSAFGTTSVSVTVLSNGVPVTSPQTVSFSSACAGSGKAALTASVLTGAGGVATASYRDIGCGGTDTITAAVSGVTPSAAILTISIPAAGSIQFVSATPKNITLKGTGGAGLQETSQVIFKVVDTGGFPIGNQLVSFSLSTNVGGITLTNATATSDPTTGFAIVTVNSGTISTPVRVLATAVTSAGVTLSTQSDQLTVTTGIPDQVSFSLSATTFNIVGLNFDGEITVLTARLSDHFSNPVPDGTTVNFIAEGGQMGPSCSTVSGSCSATMTSAAFRPLNGRITVLAYAVGEESFSDVDGDGLADLSPNELVDANGVSTDMAEAFLDNNENGIRDGIGTSGVLEQFIDFNNNGVFDVADGKYNGTLCNEPPSGTSSAGTCAATRSIHVRRNFVILFSGSNPVFTFSTGALNLAPCVDGIPFTPVAQNATVTIRDVNGNIMPAGTTVAFATTNGTIVSAPTSFVVPNSTACLTGSGPAAGFICPAASAVPLGSPPLAYGVTIKGDATQGAGPAFTCTNTTPSGFLTVTVTTPKGLVTTSSIPVNDF